MVFESSAAEHLRAASILGALIGLSSQILIFSATLISFLGGFSTYFTYPGAIDDKLPLDQPVAMATAMQARVGGLVAGPLIASVMASIGWAMGGLMNRKP